MTLISSLCSFPPIHSSPSSAFPNSASTFSNHNTISNFKPQIQSSSSSTNVCTQKIDTSLITIAESFYDDELWAASSLRIRSFNEFRPDTYGVQFSTFGEDRIVVGSLDLNQCLSLPDEIVGMKPKASGADTTRAYLSNVCVARELHRNGLAYDLLEKSKLVARNWGITDLYVHVAVDNEPAKKLYMKSGFVYESDEPAWQARFLDRPRRLLLWMGLSVS
ncbi:GCN5-related N-acetyltransferase 7, chloroplastic isoform X2 [Vicia villosa]|uniref:GCN5-related N-acetyltransferase 7, chloroplastic isoform X2 n=1 Tax=Vicia villosa TaxID=3911 RepID=UPI00273CDABA|nr:GCN5-related N-acetyltransferase 7, chloroplastic isoform X2 [Vicia villosa]